MKKKNKKKSKDQESKIEKKRNTHLYWIGILAFLGSIIGFLWNYQSDRKDEKHATEITELKTKISSIERNIGENDYFDVKQLFLSENNRNEPSPKSSYVASGNFYADTTDIDWTYKQIPQ